MPQIFMISRINNPNPFFSNANYQTSSSKSFNVVSHRLKILKHSSSKKGLRLIFMKYFEEGIQKGNKGRGLVFTHYMGVKVAKEIDHSNSNEYSKRTPKMSERPEVEAVWRVVEENFLGKKMKRSVVPDDSKVINDIFASDFDVGLLGNTIAITHRKGKNLWL
ncbi:hypothetical protein CsatA_022957 [Cannabis sativa]